MAKQAETLSAYRSRRALVSFRPQSLSTETARRGSRKISSAIGDAIRALRSHCQPHRKRESQHHVKGCGEMRLHLKYARADNSGLGPQSEKTLDALLCAPMKI